MSSGSNQRQSFREKIRAARRDYPGFLSPWGRHSPGWQMLPRFLRSLRTWKILIAVLLAIGFIQHEIAGVYRVPSGSMKNTLLVGDVFLANKLAYGVRTPSWVGITGTHMGKRLPSKTLIPGPSPRSGDVVIFRHPEKPGLIYVKRIAATGGDTLEIARKEVRVNGRPIPPPPNGKMTFTRIFREELHDPTIYPPGAGNRDYYGPVVVPENQLFVLGDNRDSSADSRYWGFLPEELVIGKVEMVLWSHGPATGHAYACERFRPERIATWVF